MSIIERRFSSAPGALIQWRAEGETKIPDLVGHASVFDEWTTLYESRYWTWLEVVRPGAFRDAIKENQDVRSLFNHDPNFVLGRTTSKTLQLREDKRGLATETELLNSQTINDLVIGPVNRKDISGMSFAFRTRNEGDETITEKEDGSVIIERSGERITLYEKDDRLFEERELLSVNLYDISVVTYPAYEGTDVGLRSMPPISEEEARKLLSRKSKKRTLFLMSARQRLAEAEALS